MKEATVSYPIAVALKAAGFDWECRDVYSEKLPDHEPFDKTTDAVRYFQLTGESLFIQTLYPAPTLALAQRWLREAKGVSVESGCCMSKQWLVNICDIVKFGEVLWAKIGFDSYESALEIGIAKVLEILNENKQCP